MIVLVSELREVGAEFVTHLLGNLPQTLTNLGGQQVPSVFRGPDNVIGRCVDHVVVALDIHLDDYIR